MKVTISAADHMVDRLPEFVASLKAAGVTVNSTLESVGIVVGSIDPGQLARVRGLPGVAAVVAEQTMSIVPPDSPIQ